ncbi:MAG: polysaccharide biosynthesis tyrosine autokinase [Armatimonadetes bacterium]|nr:polysaccharide biosynthesis tyrosine autokinase [Armatimonadota bacterium]
MTTVIGAQRASQQAQVQDYAEILLRRLPVALLTGILVFGLSVIFTMRQPRVYQAIATLLLTPRQTRAQFVPSFLPSQAAETLVQIVGTYEVADRAARKIENRPERVDQIRGLVQGGVSAQSIRGTDVLRISAKGSNPQMVARIANATAESLIELGVEAQRAEANAVRRFLEDQLAQANRDLEAAERARVRAKMEGRGVSVSDEVAARLRLLADLDARRLVTQIDRREAQMRLDYTNAELRRQFNLDPTLLAQNSLVTALRDRLAALEVELIELQQRYTEQHPAIQIQRSRIQAARASLRKTLVDSFGTPGGAAAAPFLDLQRKSVETQAELYVVDARERFLDTLISRQEADLKSKLPGDLAELQGLRNLRVMEQVFSLLSQRLFEAKILEASLLPGMRIVDPAQVPGSPTSPNRAVNTLLGLVVGLLFGVVAAFAAESLDNSFRTVNEVERVVELPVVGTIPTLGGDGDHPAPDGVALVLASSDQRESPFAEAFRGLRTSLLYASPESPPRVLLITSPGWGEGKSTVASNLAITLAQFGKRVWLVEADLRHRRLDEAFAAGTAGLAHYLLGSAALDDIAHPTGVEGLTFVPAGTTPAQPADLLGSPRMRSFLAAAREQADFVIFDAVPCLPVTDAVTLAPHVDGILMVVEANRTPKDAVVRARRLLADVGGRILGVVFTRVSTYGRAGYDGFSYSGNSMSAPDRLRNARNLAVALGRRILQRTSRE